jgi:hypothetical protein
LYRSAPLPEWLRNGVYFGETGLELELDRGVVETLQIRRRMLDHFRRLGSTPSADRHLLLPALLTCVSDALNLDASLRIWASSAPLEYGISIVATNKLHKDHSEDDLFYSSVAYVYDNAAKAIAWNRCRGARLIINGLIQKAAGWADNIAQIDQQPSLEILSPRAETMKTITQIVNDICASVPYFFGATDPSSCSRGYSDATATHVYTLAWPLVFAAGALHVPDEQREWIRNKLELIGRVTNSPLIANIAKVGHAGSREVPTDILRWISKITHASQTTTGRVLQPIVLNWSSLASAAL